MSETETIALRVKGSTKENWQEYADGNDEYDSLSHLIRVAVSHEMSDAYGRDGSAGSVDDGRLSEVLEAVNRLEGEMGDLQQSVDNARDEIGTAVTKAPDAGKVLNALPPKDDLVDQYREEDDEWVQERADDGATAIDVARELDASVDVVRESLRQLRVRYDRVESAEIDGVTFWYKNV
jgi:uncharacterized protein (UPF0335 family)